MSAKRTRVGENHGMYQEYPVHDSPRAVGSKSMLHGFIRHDDTGKGSLSW